MISALTSTSAFIDGRVGYLDPKSARELDGRLAMIHNDLNRVIATLRKSTK
jgi:hypothetical protein